MSEAIFLSASVPDPKRDPENAQTADTIGIQSAVSALLYVTLGRRLLVWGGHPAITPMIWVIAESMGVDYGQWVRLYQSQYWADEFPEDNARFQNVTFTEKKDTREASLQVLRERMFTEHEYASAVFIGGMGGIVDEFELFSARQPKACLVPVLSTGGATLKLANRVRNLSEDLSSDLDYVALFHRRLRVSPTEIRYPRPTDQPADPARRVWRPEA